MYEDRPSKDTPIYVAEALREYGGESPSGLPIWQLVLAQNCRIRCFGSMNHMPDGFKASDLPEDARPTDTNPVRIEVGEFWVPRYRVKGWILRRWFPASAWGTREKWESERAKDDRTRLLAAYPAQGDYQMMPGGPWKTIVQAGDLTGAIRAYNVQQRRNPVRWDLMMEEQLAFEALERQSLADAYADQIASEHREGFEHYLRSTSTAAQELRNVVSKHTTSGVNLGASEKWG